MPLPTISLAALERLPAKGRSPLVFPSPKGDYVEVGAESVKLSLHEWAWQLPPGEQREDEPAEA